MGEEWRANLEMDGQGAEVVEKRLEGSRRRLLDAPVLVLLCLYLEDLDAYPDAERQRGETTMAVQSLGAAAQNALLAAYDSASTRAGCAPRSSALRRSWRRWASTRSSSRTRCLRSDTRRGTPRSAGAGGRWTSWSSTGTDGAVN